MHAALMLALLAAPSVEQAIARVFPALVQIRAVALDHSGGRERKHEVGGSGVIISSDGYVVTNHHVAGKAASVKVTLSSREELDARLVASDALADIAVLKLDLSSRRANAPPLTAAKFGSSAALKVGDTVLAMGCPLALSHSVTEGIVANKDLMMRPRGGRFLLDGEDVGSLVKWIGHDATIQPGNSGGPLVNLEGEVVGINEIGLGTMSGAIPSELAQATAEELIAHGKVRRAFLGADFQPLLKVQQGDPDARGVLVAAVTEGSPADQAGLRKGDVVVAADGQPVSVKLREELPAFNLLVATRAVGQPVELRVLRSGKERTVRVKAAPREEAEGKRIEVKEWGLDVEPVTEALKQELQFADESGVLVSSVRPGGPADQAAPPLLQHDRIVEIAGKPVGGVPAFVEATRLLTAGKAAPVPTLATVERKTERLLSLVEIGLRTPQAPPGEVRRPWLAVFTQVMTRKLAAALDLKGKSGVRVTQVLPDSSAEAAGFKVGDVITHIDGVVVAASEPHDTDVFEGMVHAYKLGSKPEFTVIRGGKPLTIAAPLDEAPRPDREMRVYDDPQLEFRAREVSLFDRVKRRLANAETGALVTQVEPGGWAAVGGLLEDDLIESVDGQPVAALPTLETQLKAARERKVKQIVLLVRRGVHTLFVELEPQWGNP
ncbi:MAG TPA: PDZ domain-containing protein [Myxococcales bacterium]|nr:PDZ domain-containing protein [Myxococcales bacterium]